MQRVKKIFRLVHLFVWLLFTSLVSLQLRTDDQSNWLPLTTGFILTCLYVFYSHFYLLTLYLGKNKKREYFSRLAIIVFTGPIPFVYFHPKKPDGWDPFLGYYTIAVLTMVPAFLFLSWLARVTENLVLNTIRKEQLEKQAAETELHYLKSQINPHFLFNTLNNIHTLVYKQAPTAPEAVLRLASLMRYMIYESNAPTVPLTREINYLQDYIGLQQLRYKNSPVVDLILQGAPETCEIAPLLFIHLLENAYKHSPARLEPSAIKVRVEIKPDSLTFQIQNPIGTNQQQMEIEEPGGIGLVNVQKRLQLQYPDQHRLNIQNTGDTFRLSLEINGTQAHVHERETKLLHH
ncbi:sensor histidine kinase [Rufibacter latericius]|uniref:GHKL domain-containing protein n=1 Tax=Rufibacter latericius TaxID=2487040 RepID=A0A3M9MAR6_9BACT|nr:histidine kinase [Rufibacter latericius]RNI22670.1 GHKL domain-containing protein [Rufibacter latericius]